MRHLEDLFAVSRRALFAALALGRETDPHPLAVDATAGNGRDTLFLADHIGEAGRVWAFDPQEAALSSARRRLETEAPGLAARVCFVHGGHETARGILPPDAAGHLRAVTFNLGYLPGGDKRIVTRTHTTLAALNSLSGPLAVGGVISAHAYGGHQGGEEESAAVARWFAALAWEQWRVARYAFCNKPHNPESLFLAEKIRG